MNGKKVAYTYRRHYLLGGEQVSGTGTVITEIIVGTDNGYAIKPDDGGDVVHVRRAGVWELPGASAPT